MADTIIGGMVPGTVNNMLRPLVDLCYQSMMAANGATPYVHEEYQRWDDMLKAALALLTNGDMPYARALRWGFLEGADHIGWLLSQWSRDVMCRDAGEMSQEDYDATLRFAVECEEQGDTWTEAFETREQAEACAAELAANTTVVDRHATTEDVCTDGECISSGRAILCNTHGPQVS